MELYNELIRETEGLLEGKPFRRWDYEAGMSWPDTGESELVLMRDAAYELGGRRKAGGALHLCYHQPGLGGAG